jgi:hypothetical protein
MQGIQLLASAVFTTPSRKILVTIPLIFPAEPRGKSREKAQTFTISKKITDFR